MAVFNSLGSNYRATDVLQNLLGVGNSKKTAEEVRRVLASRYKASDVILTYKGRQALELGLKALNLQSGSEVGINGFTCYVVYQAVERAGYKPVLIDVPDKGLNFDPAALKAAHQKHHNLRAIIVQNTLGVVADMPGLEAYCNEQGIAIIEDLAHSVGARYQDGREAGAVGAMTMLSFSQDKPLDVVAGGALVNRTGVLVEHASLPLMAFWPRRANRLYPFWTGLIRLLYPVKVGRYVHFGLKKLRLLATPMSDNLKTVRAIDPQATPLLRDRLRRLEEELQHRRKISSLYQNSLAKACQIPTAQAAALIRFPIWIDRRGELIDYLKRFNIYIGDTWYDAPIAPKRYMQRTNYHTGDCPNAEVLAEHIVNLPTHVHVTESKARYIATKVNEWLQLQ